MIPTLQYFPAPVTTVAHGELMASTLIMLARPPNWGQPQKGPRLQCQETTADFKLSSVHVFLSKLPGTQAPRFAPDLLQPTLPSSVLQPT